MPRTTKSEAPVLAEVDGYVARVAAIGPYSASFESFAQDADPTELFAGLPDGRCQCPHWGTIVTGQIVFRFADREETFRAGDVYYAEPGHLPLVFAGTEVVEFSPTDKLEETMAVVGAALQNAAG
ncbi:MAG: cupin domain-containing protein [Jatrophihabitantaceae bacterium]